MTGSAGLVFFCLCIKIKAMQDRNLLEHQPVAWTPTSDVVERAQLTKFMKQVGASTWDDLYQFSIRDVEKFTEEVLKFLDIRFDPPYEKLLDTSNGPELPVWFASPQRRGVAEAETRPVGSVPGSEEDLPQSRKAAKSEPGGLAAGSHAGLNITTMCLDRWQTDEMKDQRALIWEGEDSSTKTLTYSELCYAVASCASGLRANGLGIGDAIGVHLPMNPETVIALLAIGRIGAIAVPVFSGYGVEAIVSRMNAVGAKALFTSLGFTRRGKLVQSYGFEAAGKCPTVKMIFLCNQREPSPRASKPVELNHPRPEQVAETGQHRHANEPVLFDVYDVKRSSIEHPCKVVRWDALMSSGKSDNVEPTSAEDPLIILYTSGTTGKPKGIAHTHASFPIKAAQDMAFGTDVGKGTRICWYTDIGWMMGPWLIYGALINGATICIYDGAPDYPTADRMWEFCAKHKVEVLGISPTLIRSLAAREDITSSPPYEGGVASASSFDVDDGVVLPPDEISNHSEPKAENHPVAEAATPLLGKEGSFSAPYKRHDLSSLRIFGSTGEPWNPAPWWWLFEKVGNSKLPIINYSGGTEIAGGILMGNPLLPIKPCSFPAPCPGMDVDIVNETGESVGPNEVGELVIRQPWIGMARGFWQDRQRYLDTYWRRFENIWVHGDWAMRDDEGHWFILGRSDDTLKVAGKRVGPAEVEGILVSHPEIVEAAVIGVPDEAKGTVMVAFVVAGDSAKATREASLETELKALVSRDMGKPLAPSKIHFISALPKTRNAKVMRRVLRAAYLGEDPGDLSALENQVSLNEIRSANRA